MLPAATDTDPTRPSCSTQGAVQVGDRGVVQQDCGAQAADRGKVRVLAAVGDRLGKPLHAVLLFSAGLQRNARQPLQPSIDRLKGNVDAMGGLLEELLEI